IAVTAGWLSPLVTALERWGRGGAITPDISPLDVAEWRPKARSGQVVTLDEQLDFRWTSRSPVTRLLSTVLGCAMLMRRDVYFRGGGFDLGLRRWGCEFVDLILKVYAGGGACVEEASVLVGHLFRSSFPYGMHFRAIVYN